ncbi:MAG: hypothetical protein GX126_05295 [Bacteroidales bacterium]|nr:hypothetical protein [Bacteroidales bacterium]
MKQIILLLTLAVSLFSGCQNKDSIIMEAEGTVNDYAGEGNCRFVLELDNGSTIQPLYYPENFIFLQGQRIFVRYKELPDNIPVCDHGVPVDILYIEELGCAPYINLNSDNYDSLAWDPLYLNEAVVDDNHLKINVSYGGGCKRHTIDLAMIHGHNADSEEIPLFEIRHNANGDMCEAYITKDVCFDLTELIIQDIYEFIVFANQGGEDNFLMTFKIE